MGEREKMKAQAQVEFERIQREMIEIRRLGELERLDRTTSGRMGDLDSDNPKKQVHHLPNPARRAGGSVREA